MLARNAILRSSLYAFILTRFDIFFKKLNERTFDERKTKKTKQNITLIMSSSKLQKGKRKKKSVIRTRVSRMSLHELRITPLHELRITPLGQVSFRAKTCYLHT